jgi:RNA-directed DNA polymerase
MRTFWEDQLATVALDGPWTRQELTDRLAEPMNDPVAAEAFAVRLMEHCPRMPTGTPEDLARLIRALPPLPEPSVEPEYPRWRWPVPRWETTTELADALDLRPSELDWLADARGWNRRAAQPIRHYRPYWLRTGTGGIRLIEAPKPRLAELQRRLLRHLLAAFPIHPAAHGFRRGRSPASYAAPHAGQALVVRLDLEGFFAAVTGARVRAILATAGYQPTLVKALAGLLTTTAPVDVLAAAPPAPSGPRWRLLRRLAAPHLPQGAPSSPALANVVAMRLDRRLAGLAESLGANYSRYADDLAFSGRADLPLHRLLPGVRRIAQDEGFRIRDDKSRIRAAHQRQTLAGLVVNESPAVSRQEYDQLRAILHNCVRTGPQHQNRAGHQDFRAHLRGRIAWVGNTRPDRAVKLQAMFDRIPW